jgi:hypothetical protein
MDLDEGKTGAQMFSTSCVVCHQSPQGLAKGRSAGQLAGFLRQHYTTGTGQAGVLANYLTTGGLERGNATPVRTSVPDKPEKPEPPTSRRQRPDDARGKPEPDVATTHPNRRIRLEDGSTQPVDGLVVLPPGAEQVPAGDAKPDRRRDARPAEPAHPTHQRQRQPRPSDVKPAESKPAETKPVEAKPAEPAKPVETAKPAEPEPTPVAPAVQAEAPRPPRDPATAHSPLTEDLPKPAPSQIQEIPL